MFRRFGTYTDFWKSYLRDHSNWMNRALHILGIGLAIAFLGLAFYSGERDWLLPIPGLALVPGWLGHLLFERAFPATFGHPAWSLFSDFRMFSLWLIGSLNREIARASPRAGPKSAGMYELNQTNPKRRKRRRTRID